MSARFLQELKRRRVVRVAVVYAATAFVVLQAADLIGAGLALPAWVFAAVTFVTILGFPLALVLAWAFQITREDASRTTGAERWITGRTIAVVAGAVVLVVAGGWFVNPVVSARVARGAAGSDAVRGPVIATLLPPPGEAWSGSFAISPDGRRVAIVASADGAPGRLVIRLLDGLATEPLPNTAGATQPFWSPDGRSLGFFARGRLRVLDLAGGAVRELCPATAPSGGAWGERGVILYSPERDAGLHRTSATGGACTPVPLRGSARPGWGVPFFLGDGRHFVLSTDDDAWLGRVDGDSLTHLRRNTRAISVGAAPVWLLFRTGDDPAEPVRSSALWSAHRIDLRVRRLAGDPVRLPDDIGGRAVSVSRNGALVTQARSGAALPMLVRVERGGALIDSLVLRENVWSFRASHDGRRLAFGGFALWLHDVARGVTTRAVAAPDTAPQTFAFPVWSPGDTLIAFAQRYRGQALGVFDTRTGSVRTIYSPAVMAAMTPADWSADGRLLAFIRGAGAGSVHSEAWVYDFAAQQARRLFEENGSVRDLRFSPDARWVAYESSAAGDDQIYLRRIDGGGAVRVSSAGGRLPRWRADGQELYYATSSGAVMAASVRLAADITLSAPQPVVPFAPLGEPAYDSFEPTPDGRRFTFRMATGRTPGLTLVLDWLSLLEGAK